MALKYFLTGESGFAWSWLSVAMQATNLPYGVVCAAGQHHHPAIIAQAAATKSRWCNLNQDYHCLV